jgi:YidC/Oxa1 family membrane protein insertase
MDKRVLLTVVLCMGILFAWQKFFAPPPPTPTKPPAAESGAQPASPAAPGAPVPGAPPAQPAAPAPTDGKAVEAKPEAPVAARPEAVVDTIERPGLFRARFTTWGAAPLEWTLLDPQYQETHARDEKKDLRPINLVRTSDPRLPLIVTFPDSAFKLGEDAAWTREKATADELVYAWQNDQVRVEKHYTFTHGYDFKLAITVENRGDKPLGEKLELAMYGWQDPSVKPGGMFSQRFIQTSGVCDDNGKLKQADLQALFKAPVEALGQIRWIGYDEKYFLAAAATKPVAGEDRKCRISAYVDGTIGTTLRFAERTVAPKEKTEYELAGFMGPKILGQLDDVKVGGIDTKLSDAVDYGWKEMLARPMLWVLQKVHVVVPNWGIAIIVLTLLIKGITWWPTTKSMRSMKAMASLKPEMDKLKAKFGDDKARMNQEVMELYKRHGVNPLGGCLPMLIQFPIYIALYSMLGNSVELYRSGFLWIHDLTAPDPFYILPLVTGVLMFVQQKTAPQSPDAQAKAMMYTMPLMFTAFSIFLPAGLTVYILTNALLTFAQQVWMNRGDRGSVVAKPAKA